MIQPLIFETFAKDIVFLVIIGFMLFWILLYFIDPGSFGHLMQMAYNAFPHRQTKEKNTGNDWRSGFGFTFNETWAVK